MKGNCSDERRSRDGIYRHSQTIPGNEKRNRSEGTVGDGQSGFYYGQRKCLNWRFALQNKFIEYMKAGLPVLTSNTMEQGSIVKNTGQDGCLRKILESMEVFGADIQLECL